MSDEQLRRCAATFEEEIARHEGLLRRWARYYVLNRNFVTVEDLMHEGRLAMWEMWPHYDQSMGVKFMSFATPHVRRKMLWHVMQATETIRVPRQQTLGEWLKRRVRVVSLNALMVNGHDGSECEEGLEAMLASEAVGPHEEVAAREDLAHLKECIACLPESVRDVAQARFVNGELAPDLARRMKRSRQRIYQIEADAVVMLRRMMVGGREALPSVVRRKEAA